MKKQVPDKSQNHDTAMDMFLHIHPGYMFFDLQSLPQPDRVCFADIFLNKTVGDWGTDTRGCMFLYLSLFMTQDDEGRKRLQHDVTSAETRAIHDALEEYTARQDNSGTYSGFSQVLKSYAAYR
jgi:hypothetical protein